MKCLTPDFYHCEIRNHVTKNNRKNRIIFSLKVKIDDLVCTRANIVFFSDLFQNITKLYNNYNITVPLSDIICKFCT